MYIVEAETRPNADEGIIGKVMSDKGGVRITAGKDEDGDTLFTVEAIDLAGRGKGIIGFLRIMPTDELGNVFSITHA